MPTDVKQFESCISLKLPAGINRESEECSSCCRGEDRGLCGRSREKTADCKADEKRKNQPKQAFCRRDKKLKGIRRRKTEKNNINGFSHTLSQPIDFAYGEPYGSAGKDDFKEKIPMCRKRAETERKDGEKEKEQAREKKQPRKIRTGRGYGLRCYFRMKTCIHIYTPREKHQVSGRGPHCLV